MSDGTTVDGVDVDAVHGIVTSTPGVSGLGSGLPGAMTTYLPGRHVAGIRISEAAVDVEVAVSWDRPVTEVARDLQRRLAGVTGGRQVNVVIADLAMPDDDPAPSDPDPSGSAPAETVAAHTGETS